jgi:alkanesulfonate monooxygenase SsuD/methylene tetrahydromethanopterin reductase-like flavin-dependent oxidoreductase (luciferase family)
MAKSTDVPTRPFRFGVVATPVGEANADAWIATAKRTEELGYSTLLMPDGVQLLSPFSSLAVAATVTSLRVGTYVLASPLRTPRQAAWEAHSLTVLTGGRFDMGIGTGHDRVPQGAAELGMPYGTASERRDQVKQTVAHLRELDGDVHTPVMMAAAGPRALALAAEIADIVAVAAAGPFAARDEVAALTAGFRETAGSRAAEIELAMNLFVIGDQVPPWVQGFLGADARQLIAADSLAMLRGTVDEMVDELRRRRDAIGTSYISVNQAFYEELAPVVERLTGS